MKNAKTPEQAVRRLKVIGSIIGVMAVVIIITNITSDKKPAETTRSDLEIKMDSQLDSLLRIRYPEGAEIVSTGPVERLQEETDNDVKWRNIIRKYEMASERESMTEEEIDRLIAETNTARKKLAEPRPYCFHRNSLVRLPDGSERYIYQKMSSDSTRSEIILNAPKAKPDDKMPNFEKTE